MPRALASHIFSDCHPFPLCTLSCMQLTYECSFAEGYFINHHMREPTSIYCFTAALRAVRRYQALAVSWSSRARGQGASGVPTRVPLALLPRPERWSRLSVKPAVLCFAQLCLAEYAMTMAAQNRSLRLLIVTSDTKWIDVASQNPCVDLAFH